MIFIGWHVLGGHYTELPKQWLYKQLCFAYDMEEVSESGRSGRVSQCSEPLVKFLCFLVGRYTHCVGWVEHVVGYMTQGQYINKNKGDKGAGEEGEVGGGRV